MSSIQLGFKPAYLSTKLHGRGAFAQCWLDCDMIFEGLVNE